ncbi:MAG: type II secretion system protein [Planctomycetota bacterium]
MKTKPSGLTMIELVIVLIILAALTGIAVQSLDPIADQARFESTQRTLENIDAAFLGRDSGGAYIGFIADMGRLPENVNSDPSLALGELWTLTGTPHDIHSFSDPTLDTDDIATGVQPLLVPVVAGWRGPYVNLPPGGNNLVDSFGRPFIINSATVGQSVVSVISQGPDSSVSDDDLALPSGTWNEARFSEDTVLVSVQEIDGGDVELDVDETLRIRLYGARDGAPSLLGEAPLETNGTGAVISIPTTRQFVLQSNDPAIPIPFGRKTLVAVVTDNSTPPVVQHQGFRQFVHGPSGNEIVVSVDPN